MKTKINAALYRLVRLADAEGLSYGAYVARESGNNVRRGDRAADGAIGGLVGSDERAFNDQKRKLTTQEDALPIDCPSFCVENLPKNRTADPLADEELIRKTIRLYRMGYNTDAIGKRLGADGAVIGVLRRAENELKTHKRSLPPDKALEVISLNARGVSYRNIAAKCNITLTDVVKCLTGARSGKGRRFDDEILF